MLLPETPLLILFALTLFLSAFLLFWVQLLVAKLILPLLGGSPSVWNTCLFFFQTMLLLGYAYAYGLTQRLPLRQQTLLHGLVLLLPLPLLPIALRQNWLSLSPEQQPLLWLLMLLGLMVGLPFFVVATSAPLLQRWFAATEHPDSGDPYFLYAASNTGSMVGLLAYPLGIEPLISLPQQSQVWAIAYGVWILLVLGCGVCLWRLPLKQEHRTAMTVENPPSRQQQGRWLLLSALPASLLLGTTTYLTTDIAAIPLLWAVPLALYLLTFILAFSRKPLVPYQVCLPLLPLVIPALVILLLLKVNHPLLLILPLHLLGLFLVSYVLHGALAESRPSPEYLTRFYLWIAAGGVLGGLFNAIAAPLLFSTVLEYPLLLILSLLLVPALSPVGSPKPLLRLTLPLSIGLLLGGLMIGFHPQQWQHNLAAMGVGVGLLAAIAPTFKLKPATIATGCLLILLLNQFSINSLGGVLSTQRSFFGVYQVLQDQQTQLNTLLHGTTVHGMQSFEPQRQRQPLTYFSRTGPIGQVFATLNHRQPQHRQARTAKAGTPETLRVAVLGLGVGTLAAYAEPGQQWTFYEIDPVVEAIAQDERYFTYLADAPVPYRLITGDARLRIANAPGQSYDLIVMDAFSSDAIPVHLITREAVQLYLSKLASGGMIAVNITNRYLDLEPVLFALAKDLDLVARTQYDRHISDSAKAAGESASRWVILSPSLEAFGPLTQDQRWQPLIGKAGIGLWTDDFSNLLQILKRH